MSEETPPARELPHNETGDTDEMATALERISRACDEELRLPYYRKQNPPAVIGTFTAIKHIADGALISSPSKSATPAEREIKAGSPLHAAAGFANVERPRKSAGQRKKPRIMSRNTEHTDEKD